MDTLWSVLATVADAIQVGAVVFTILAFWRARRELRNFLKSRPSAIRDRPHALIVGIGTDIEGTVRRYLAENGRGDLQENFHNCYVRRGITPTNFDSVLKEILQLKNELTDKGATELHLFYKGPVTLAVAMGFAFDNWIPIKTYAYEDGTYRLEKVLEKGSVKALGFGEGVLDDAASMLS